MFYRPDSTVPYCITRSTKQGLPMTVHTWYIHSSSKPRKYHAIQHASFSLHNKPRVIIGRLHISNNPLLVTVVHTGGHSSNLRFIGRRNCSRRRDGGSRRLGLRVQRGGKRRPRHFKPRASQVDERRLLQGKLLLLRAWKVQRHHKLGEEA